MNLQGAKPWAAFVLCVALSAGVIVALRPAPSDITWQRYLARNEIPRESALYNRVGAKSDLPAVREGSYLMSNRLAVPPVTVRLTFPRGVSAGHQTPFTYTVTLGKDARTEQGQATLRGELLELTAQGKGDNLLLRPLDRTWLGKVGPQGIELLSTKPNPPEGERAVWARRVQP